MKHIKLFETYLNEAKSIMLDPYNSEDLKNAIQKLAGKRRASNFEFELSQLEDNAEQYKIERAEVTGKGEYTMVEFFMGNGKSFSVFVDFLGITVNTGRSTESIYFSHYKNSGEAWAAFHSLMSGDTAKFKSQSAAKELQVSKATGLKKLKELEDVFKKGKDAEEWKTIDAAIRNLESALKNL
jgi:hypothetical protein